MRTLDAFQFRPIAESSAHVIYPQDIVIRELLLRVPCDADLCDVLHDPEQLQLVATSDAESDPW